MISIEFTVDQINGLLSILGNVPYVQSAQFINMIQVQGTPQFQAIEEDLATAAAAAEAEEVAAE
jgi:hypothetical protein